jgi:hypothetical protein
MPSVIDPRDGLAAIVMRCRSCGADVYMGLTAKGKRCPFNVVDGEATTESHFRTCPQAGSWSKKK